MPLRAIINGEDVLAPFLEEQAWERLKIQVKREGLEVRLPCCDSIAYLRTSKLGVHHFVHKVRQECSNSQPETWQHLKAKQDVVLACRAAGFEATTEVMGEGWRADVLATKGNAKIAFEIQWSPQAWQVTQERQKQYKAAGIRGCWFFRSLPSEYQITRDVPIFPINVTEAGSTIYFSSSYIDSLRENLSRAVPLSEFVVALLTFKVRWCESLRSKKQQKIRIVFAEVKCWRCDRPYHVYLLHDLVSGCGERILETEDYAFTPQIVSIVQDFVDTPEGQHLEIGPIKKRFSKTEGHSYISFGCPHCDALHGKHYLHFDIMMAIGESEERAVATLEREIVLTEDNTEEYEHWCFPENGEFCCR